MVLVDVRSTSIGCGVVHRDDRMRSGTGKHDYEVFEDALRPHLGLAGTLERIWAGITPQDAPDDVEAARIAAEELAAVRAERSPRRAGRAS